MYETVRMDFILQLSAMFILLLTLKIDDVSAKGLRSRRTTTTFGLAALKDECCDGNRWGTCCRAAVQLLNEASDENRYFQICRLEAQKETRENAGIIIDIENQDQGDFHQAGDLADETGKACPYSRQDKAEARDEYCEQLSLVHYFMLEVYLPRLETACSCVYHRSEEIRHAHAVVLKEVKQWHRDMVEKHGRRKCCNATIYFSPPPEAVQEGDLELAKCSHNSRIGCYPSNLRPDEIPPPTVLNRLVLNKYWMSNWDEVLAEVAEALRMVELLQCLGRRNTCLRGCVGENEVKCANLILRYY